MDVGWHLGSAVARMQSVGGSNCSPRDHEATPPGTLYTISSCGVLSIAVRRSTRSLLRRFILPCCLVGGSTRCIKFEGPAERSYTGERAA